MPQQTSDLCLDLTALRRRAEDVVALEAELSRELLASALDATDATVRDPGHARLEVLLQPDGVVLVRGALAVELWVPCARCLDPAAVDASTDICVTYVPGARSAPPGSEDDEGIALDAEDLEQLVYDGHTIDLHPMLREQVSLGYPIRVLCVRGTGCRGLCPHCGHNLNAPAPDAAACANCGRALGTVPGEDDSPLRAALRQVQGQVQDPHEQDGSEDGSEDGSKGE